MGEPIFRSVISSKPYSLRLVPLQCLGRLLENCLTRSEPGQGGPVAHGAAGCKALHDPWASDPAPLVGVAYMQARRPMGYQGTLAPA